MKRYIHSSTDEDFVVDYDLSKMSDEWWERQERKRIEMEEADEADAYDLEHEEGIYSSSNPRYQVSLDLGKELTAKLKKLLPKTCWPKLNPQHNQIIIENPKQVNDLMGVTSKALESLGYKVYDIGDVDEEGYDISAVRGEAFAKLGFDIGDYFNNGPLGYIDIKFDNGNVLFEDWYEDQASRSES